MDIKTKRLIFMGPIFTIFYGIFIYFLLLLISNLFNGILKWAILGITLVICGIYLISTIFEIFYPNPILRFLAFLSELWKGFSVYLFIFLVPIYIIGWFVYFPQELMAFLLFVIVPVIVIYGVYNADNPKIIDTNLEFDNLIKPIKFALISDVHIGAIRGNRLLNKIIEKINIEYENGLEFLLIAGDLADGSTPIDSDSFKTFCKSKVPIFFTSGNHDYYPGIDNVINGIKNANIINLDNKMVEINGVQIIGFSYDYGGFSSNTVTEEVNDLTNLINNEDMNNNHYHIDNHIDNLNETDDLDNKNPINSRGYDSIDSSSIDFNNFNSSNILDKDINNNRGSYEILPITIDKNKVSIAIHHVPIAWEIFKEKGIELVLAGHTHGGQLFPFNFFVKLVFPYLRGLFKDNDKYMYVSDGVGTFTPPIRIGTNSEIAVFNLKKKKK